METWPSSPSLRGKRLAWSAAALLTSVALSGCGTRQEPLVPVEGQVTYQNQTFSEARVLFSNAQKGVYLVAELDAQGKYRLFTAGREGAPRGTYAVAVLPPQIDYETGPTQSPPPPRSYPDIPSRYFSPDSSGLTVEVEEPCRFDIDLTP